MRTDSLTLVMNLYTLSGCSGFSIHSKPQAFANTKLLIPKLHSAV